MYLIEVICKNNPYFHSYLNLIFTYALFTKLTSTIHMSENSYKNTIEVFSLSLIQGSKKLVYLTTRGIFLGGFIKFNFLLCLPPVRRKEFFFNASLEFLTITGNFCLPTFNIPTPLEAMSAEPLVRFRLV